MSLNLGGSVDLPMLERLANDGVNDGDSAFSFFLNEALIAR